MKKISFLLALLILFSWGCGKSEKKEESKKETSTQETSTSNKVVARVNGRPIYEEDTGGKPLKDYINSEILYEAGLKKGLDKKVEKAVEQYKKRLVVMTLEREMFEKLPKGGEVSDKEIEDYYNQNKDKYNILSLKEITTDDKNLAEEIEKKALNGEDFDKIASDYSKSGKNVTVKDLRFNRRYNDVFSGKQAGSVSGVIQEGNQFKILKLVEVKGIPLDKSTQAIKYSILAERRAGTRQEYIDKLKNENNIKVEIIEEKK